MTNISNVAQISSFYSMLRSYDKDGNGSLSVNEIAEAPSSVKSFFNPQNQNVGTEKIVTGVFGEMSEDVSRSIKFNKTITPNSNEQNKTQSDRRLAIVE